MIPIAKIQFDKKEHRAIGACLDSGWVMEGPRVKEFEEKFVQYTGSKYACAVSSGTTALELALRAAGVKPGDIVATVSHSFIATANCIRACGAEPVFLDIESKTYNIDPEQLRHFLNRDCFKKSGSLYYKSIDRLCSKESLLSYLMPDKIGRVSAVLVVHQMGMPCDLSAILSIVKPFKIPVVEDAACAIGSLIYNRSQKKWERIGKPHGLLSCFSFHPRKILTTGEGGMITTNNKGLYDRLKLLRNHGKQVHPPSKGKSKKIRFEEYVATGFNFRLTDIQASLGIVQLDKLENILKERRKIAVLYCQLLNEHPLLIVPREPDYAKTNWQCFPVRLVGAISSKRNSLIQFLISKGIAAQPGIMNAHLQAPYRQSRFKLPESELARDQVILLPIFCGLAESQVKFITETMVSFLKK